MEGSNLINYLYKIAAVIASIITAIVVFHSRSGSNVETTLIFSSILIIGVWLAFLTIVVFNLKQTVDEDAAEITKILVEREIIIVSGLARGIDTIVHKTAIDYGGKTIAVLGTPLNKFYPPENRSLQELIMKEHLAVCQYPIGHITRPKDFIRRNRTMALLSDASIIVEAGETSGVISQGWETLRLGRPLFLWKLLLNRNLEWVKKMIKYGAVVLKDIDDLHYVLCSRRTLPSD